MEENISISLNTEEIIEEEDPTSVIAQLRRIQELNKDGDFLKKEDLDYIKNYDRKVYGRKFSSDEEDYYPKKKYEEVEVEEDSDEFYYDSETGEYFEVDDDLEDQDQDQDQEEDPEKLVEDYYDEEEEILKSQDPPSALDKFKSKSNSGESKVHDFIDVDFPILMSMTRVWFEEGRKIGTLPLVAIADQLDVPETCSIGSWREVANYFKISPQLFLNLEANSETACLDLLEHLREEKAQKLVYSLESIRRLDVLAFLKIFRNQRQNNEIFNLEAMSRTNSMHSGIGFSQMSTGRIGDSEIIAAAPVQSPMVIKKNGKILAGPPIILINHAEKTALELKNYRWLVKNLKSNLKNFHFQIVDIAELMDDFSQILEIYQNSTHVLICYNKTYLNMLNEDEEIWKFRKFVHQQTQSEFFSQGMKNLRCRSVLMPGLTTSESTGWAPVTHQYAFPSDLQGLLNRIIDSKNTI
ncbi:unnamed protein product [Caenorhabditis angaria]|uniref:Uncharacterized protein n=1 Tax=Caenorhabditis angaria TaxID=860376 RepID=A0A9P1ND32_9PELO|nr:unnamed protein product [Caenorhabditis angaria]